MAHAIQQIHDLIIAKVTGLTTTGANVFTGRVHPIERSEMPCLLVSTGDEAVSYETIGGPRAQRRDLTLEIDIVVSVNDTMESLMNTVQLEVENALSADTKLGSSVFDVKYIGRNKFLSGDGEKQVGITRLNYSVPFEVLENAPDTLLTT